MDKSQSKFTFCKNTFLLFLLLQLTACAVGPDYKRPAVRVPEQFKEAKGKMVVGQNKDWKIAKPQDDFDRGKWWKIFHDQDLNLLEEQLNISNQNIAAAYANYQQARALVDEARANYFPTLTLSSALTRQKSSGGSTSFTSVSTTGQASSGAATTGVGNGSRSRIFSSHSLIIDAAWAPDIWGLVRRTVEASAAGAQASAALLANTRLSAQGSLAQFYFELRTIDMDQKILDATVVNYKKTLQLTRNQYASGVASRADIVQAQSQLESAESLAINNQVNRATYEHAIAVLIGVPPANFSLPPKPLNKLPPSIPVSVPSALLERRPDIAQAERTMAQANAQIGVAVAAYFPSITLTGNFNDTGRGGLSRFFSIPDLGWAYGPQLSELIYDGGLRAATVKAAQAGYRSTVASYRQTVLAAFQNVEDNLSTLRILANQAVVQNQAVASAKEALQLVINQYKSGTVPYSSVITAQTNAYTAEKNAADITGLRMTAAVGLVMALGGGWSACSICDAAG